MRSTLFFCFFILSSASYAECVPFHEAPPVGEPPHSAQIFLTGEDCPVQSVSAGLFLQGERIAKRAFIGDELSGNRLLFSVAAHVPESTRAGAYVVKWVAVTATGELTLEQPFVIPCPPPSRPAITWQDVDQMVRVSYQSSDKCSGVHEIEIDLQDAIGEPVSSKLVGQYLPFSGPGVASIAAPDLDGEVRYKGTATITNAVGLRVSTNFEFTTGCNQLDPAIQMAGKRMVAQITAPDCQFPIEMLIELKHESGGTIQSLPATVLTRSFDLEIPGSDSWPAGDHTLDVAFIGTSARADVSVGVTVQCPTPRLGTPTIDGEPEEGIAELSFLLSNRDPCQSDTKLFAQIRNIDNVVVFNDSEELAPSDEQYSPTWSFPALPGSRYSVEVRAEYGHNFSESQSNLETIDVACSKPEIISQGYTGPQSSEVTALLALSQCNLPAVGSVLIRNLEGEIVFEREPVVELNPGDTFATLSAQSIRHLSGGAYDLEFTVVDNRGQRVTKTTEFLHDLDGPEIMFRSDGQPLSAGEIPAIDSLSDLAIEFRDLSEPIPDFLPYTTPTTAGSGTLHVERVDGENTPQMWFTGTLDLPLEQKEWGISHLVVRGSTGFWGVPISRIFVPYTQTSLEGYDPSKHRVGFRAIGRVRGLAMGSYSLYGIVVVDNSGQNRIVTSDPIAFNVTTLTSRSQEVLLRQGVLELPVDLEWKSDRLSQLSTIGTIPDGTYTLSVVARDKYGNPSGRITQLLDLIQQKERYEFKWPAIDGFEQVLKHSFSKPEKFTAPVKAYVKRTTGVGAIELNGRTIESEVSTLVLSPDELGRLEMNLKAIDPHINATFIVHVDDDQTVPLALKVQSFEPQFVPQRVLDAQTDTLSIRFGEQPCRSVVFDDLSGVTIRPGEVVCGVRLALDGASVVSVDSSEAVILLPSEFPHSAQYEEGFLRVINGETSFTSLRAIKLVDLQAYSATPQISFEPSPQFANRAQEGAYVTSSKSVIAGHVIVRSPLGKPIIEINGESAMVPSGSDSLIRIPLETDIPEYGSTSSFVVRAYYPDSPRVNASTEFTFVAVPPPLRYSTGEADLMLPDPLRMNISYGGLDGYVPALHSGYVVYEKEIWTENGEKVDVEISVQRHGDGELQVSLGDLDSGQYRLRLQLVNEKPVFSDVMAPSTASIPFVVVNGTPIRAQAQTFRDSDKIPFYGHLTLAYPDSDRRNDVGTVSWELLNSEGAYETYFCCSHAVDFALTRPGTLKFRAAISNRYSQEVSYSEPITVSAFTSGQLDVSGPRKTFMGYPVTYTATGLPPGFKALWRVLAPNAQSVREERTDSIEIEATEIGQYVIEVIADDGSGDGSDANALRKFITLDVDWPKIPASVIAGPTKVEYGMPNVFTVEHPPIFSGQGNGDVRRVGHWELPGGDIVEDDEWLSFALRDLPEGDDYANLYYHSWIEGNESTLRTAALPLRPVSYDWPEWNLTVKTTSSNPPALLRLSVNPQNWEEWISLGDASVTTHWDLPDFLEVIHQGPTEAIVFASDDRLFDVKARVSDSRGNVTHLSNSGVSPIERIPFEISLSLIPERTLHTTPLYVTASVDAIVVPRGRQLSRVAFYVDGNYVSSTDGSPVRIELRGSGKRTVEAVASIGGEFTSTDSVDFVLGENQKATCQIQPVGNFKLNGVAKASCNDPDGYMVSYRWYADGVLLTEGSSRIQLNNLERKTISDLSLVAIDNGGLPTSTQYLPEP